MVSMPDLKVLSLMFMIGMIGIDNYQIVLAISNNNDSGSETSINNTDGQYTNANNTQTSSGISKRPEL
jgi:hypothetical protein